MGILRFLLAACVVLWHCPEGILSRYIHPALAVQCFYVVSGFLMQMVIVSKYVGQRHWRRRFYLSRVLRIYPLYLLFLALTILLTDTSFTYYTQHGKWAAAAAWVSNNVFLVGQDILRFFYFDVQTGHFAVLPASLTERGEIYSHGTAMPMSAMGQSWTLAIEMYFYLLAPLLLVRSSRALLLTVIGLLALRPVLGYSFGPRPELLYGFFPTELPLFLSGSLAYRAYVHLFKSGRILQTLQRVNAGEKTLSLLCAVVVAGGCWTILTCNLNSAGAYAYTHLHLVFLAAPWENRPLNAPAGYWLVLLMAIGMLPFALHFSQKFSFDRYIGELSYPVYISHILIVELTQHRLHPGPEGQAYIGVFVLVLSVVLSVVLIEFMEKPIDRFRHRLAGVRS